MNIQPEKSFIFKLSSDINTDIIQMYFYASYKFLCLVWCILCIFWAFLTKNITFDDSKEPINTYFSISMFKQHLMFLEYHENLQERNKKIHLETTIVSYKCLFNYKLLLVEMLMTIIDYRNIFVAFLITPYIPNFCIWIYSQV